MYQDNCWAFAGSHVMELNAVNISGTRDNVSACSSWLSDGWERSGKY
jgi:hypothetical protein